MRPCSTKRAKWTGTRSGAQEDLRVTYLSFVVIIVPVLIALVMAAAFGPGRGLLLAAVITIVAVFVLLIFQVTPPNMASAVGLMNFELIRWVPSFLVGAAIGSVIFASRRRSPAP